MEGSSGGGKPDMTDKPSTSVTDVTRSGQPGGQPSVSGGQPGVSGGQPGVSGGQPGVSGGQPGVSGGQPGVSGRQPGVSGGQSGVSGGQSSVSGGQPGVSGGQPGVSGGQSGVSGGQSGVSGGQPGVSGGQPGVTDQHPIAQKEKKKPVPLPRSPGPSNIEAGASTDGAAADAKPTKTGRLLPETPQPVVPPDAPSRRHRDKKDKKTKLSDGERAQQTGTEHQEDGDNGQGSAEAEKLGYAFVHASDYENVDKKELTFMQSGDYENVDQKKLAFMQSEDCEKSQTKKVEDFMNSGDYENVDKKELTLMQSGDYENVAQKKLAFMQSGVHFKNNLNTVDDEDNTSPGEDPVSKSHDTSNDSDLEVLGNDREEETSEDITRCDDLPSIQPPFKAMVVSTISTKPEEPQEAKKDSEKDQGNVAAEISSKDSVAEKNRPFQLKPVRDGKFDLIKSDACSKPFRYTPKYGEVSLDEDGVLYDGDNLFTILIEDGIIVLDEIVEAGTTNTTPPKPTESGGKVVEESGASKTKNDKTPKQGPSASENCVPCRLEYFFYHIMESSKFKKEFQLECPSVKLHSHELLLEEKKIKVILQSEGEEELEEAKEWVYKYQDNFVFTDFSYKDLQGLNCFEKSGDIIRQFLKEHLEGKDVHHEINETAHMISIWSESLGQGNLDQATKEVRDSVRNNKVIKTVSIPMSSQDLKEHVKQSKVLTSDEKKCVKIGDKAKISGLAYIVDRIKEQTTKSGGGQSNPATKAPSSSSQYTNPKQLKAGSANTKEPEAQNIEDRGASEQGAGKELSWNAEQLQEFEDHKVLINVTKIPKDKTWKDLQSEFKCQQPCGPRLVYLNGSGKALLIFKSQTDMAKFKDKPQEYEFCMSMKRCLGNFTIRVNPDMWKKLRADTKDKLEQRLNEIGVHVIVTKDKSCLNTSTLFQLQVAKEIWNEVITSMTKECTIDVPELVWKTVSVLERQTIMDIEKQCGKSITFSGVNSQICLPEMIKGMEDSFRTLKQAIDDMKLKEIQDVPLTKEEVLKAEDACGQMVQGCCIFDKTSKTVFLYSDSFDELSKYKVQFDIKIGRKNATARGNRSNAHVLSQHTPSSEINTASKLSSHSSSLDKKSFTTNEDRVSISSSVHRILGNDECFWSPG